MYSFPITGQLPVDISDENHTVDCFCQAQRKLHVFFQALLRDEKELFVFNCVPRPRSCEGSHWTTFWGNHTLSYFIIMIGVYHPISIQCDTLSYFIHCRTLSSSILSYCIIHHHVLSCFFMFDNIILTIIFSFDPSWEFARTCLMRTTRIPTFQCSSLAKALADCCALWLKLRKSGSTACSSMHKNSMECQRVQKMSSCHHCHLTFNMQLYSGRWGGTWSAWVSDPPSSRICIRFLDGSVDHMSFASAHSHDHKVENMGAKTNWRTQAKHDISWSYHDHIMPTSYVHTFEELQCMPACVFLG